MYVRLTFHNAVQIFLAEYYSREWFTHFEGLRGLLRLTGRKGKQTRSLFPFGIRKRLLSLQFRYLWTQCRSGNWLRLVQEPSNYPFIWLTWFVCLLFLLVESSVFRVAFSPWSGNCSSFQRLVVQFEFWSSISNQVEPWYQLWLVFLRRAQL